MSLAINFAWMRDPVSKQILFCRSNTSILSFILCQVKKTTPHEFWCVGECGLREVVWIRHPFAVILRERTESVVCVKRGNVGLIILFWNGFRLPWQSIVGYYNQLPQWPCFRPIPCSGIGCTVMQTLACSGTMLVAMSCVFPTHPVQSMNTGPDFLD